MQEAVKLIKASAGAGKTHYLTNEYVRLLLEGGPDSYRHILAVTFTNKATEEMKSRVIERLSELSADKSDPDSEKAEAALTAILHDYTSFGVSTIDGFFQKVMRSFAREIGQYASYKVELDTGAVIDQALDLMNDSLEDPANKDLLEWLQEYSFRQVEEGNKWDISGSLKEMAFLFFKDNFKLRLRSTDAIFADRAKLKSFDEKLRKFIIQFRSRLKELAEEGLKMMSAAGVTPSDFKGKSRGPVRVFNKWNNGEAVVHKDNIYEAIASSNVPELGMVVADVDKLFEENYAEYCSALLIRKNMFLLGIYTDLYKNLNKYLSDNNIVLLSESTDLLGRIIDGEDTPFVYEKIGTRFDHIMLDESQDTSVLQWQNFMPLFKECVSRGQSNLIVGDIKQCIYRWRGSDWRLISDYVGRDLGRNNIADASGDLGSNWRSRREIVEFNNSLFCAVGDLIAVAEPEIGAKVKEIYSGCRQIFPAERQGEPAGRVKISFLDPHDWKQSAMDKMMEDIAQLREKGYAQEDIAVLVRTNAEGVQVANRLISEGYGVITEESLMLGSSRCVSRVMAALSYAVDPDSALNGVMAEEYEATDLKISEGSIYEMCEGLFAQCGVGEGDVPFVNAFLDNVLTYQDKYGSSLKNFVKWWNDTLCRKSITVPDGQNAVKVMTIHKAKGLSLEAVIVPFLEEKFVRTGSLIETIWCNTSGRFSELGLIPLKSTKALEDTVFRDQYHEEKLYEIVDDINTAYVALTRSKSQLLVYAPAPADPEDYKVDSFAAVLFSHLKESLDESGCYYAGQLVPFSKKREVRDCRILGSFSAVSPEGRLNICLSGQDYFDIEQSPRLEGIRFHDILSKVDLEEGLEEACKGDSEAYALLSRRIAEVRGYHWFDGTFRSLNERSIVAPDGTVSRPDRILIDDNSGRAVVVDYKFGVRRKRHAEQVEGYCSLLREAGYGSVEGYLWYVNDNLVLKV